MANIKKLRKAGLCAESMRSVGPSILKFSTISYSHSFPSLIARDSNQFLCEICALRSLMVFKCLKERFFFVLDMAVPSVQKLTPKGLTRPCEEYLVRNDIYELDLVNFFDSTLTPMNQQNFSSQLEILSLTVFRCDGDMLDNQGLGRKASKRFSKR